MASRSGTVKVPPFLLEAKSLHQNCASLSLYVFVPTIELYLTLLLSRYSDRRNMLFVSPLHAFSASSTRHLMGAVPFMPK